MTKRIAFTMLAALAAVPAAAQTPTPAPVASRTLPVIGNTPQVCAMQRGRIQPGGLININGLDGDALRILQLTDPQTLATRAASATISFEAFCNFPHQVRLESQNNGLWPTDLRMNTPASGFASALPYKARVSWGDVEGTLDANANVRQISDQRVAVADARAGDLLLRIQIDQGASNVMVNAPVLAGQYSDTLRIFLEPR